DKVKEFMGVAHRQVVAKKTDSKSAARRLFGLQVQDLTPELSEAFGLQPSQGGALIADIEEGSPADDAGLKRGLVVFRVGRYPVKNASHLETVLQQAKSGAVA